MLFFFINYLRCHCLQLEGHVLVVAAWIEPITRRQAIWPKPAPSVLNSISEPVRKCLRALEAAETDTEKFATLFLVPKLVRGSDCDKTARLYLMKVSFYFKIFLECFLGEKINFLHIILIV